MKGTRVLLGLALMVVALAGCSLDGGLSLRAEGDGGAARHATDEEFMRVVQDDPAYLSGDGKTRYQFSQGGQRLTVDGIAYIKAWLCKDTRRAVYRREDSQLFYGLQVSDGGQMIQMTRWSSPQIIRWNTLGWAAHLVEEKKASFCDNVLNHSFMFRPKDDTGDGLYLYTWEFSDSGKKVSLKKTAFKKDAETIGTWTVSDSGQDGLKGTANGATFTLSEDLGTITVESCSSDSSGNGTFSRSYSDPGPSFLNRVKGATYSRGETKYTFSEDGKELTMEYKKFGPISSFPYLGYYIETKKYTYDPSKDNDVGNQFANYGGFRVQLTKNDDVINMATVPNVGGASVMEYGADRQ